MALKGVEGVYGKFLTNTGSVASPAYAMVEGNAAVYTTTVGSRTYLAAVFGPATDAEGNSVDVYSSNLSSNAQSGYDALIAELSDPGNTNSFAQVSDLNINKRRQKFLDPKPGYNAAAAHDSTDNVEHLWRDPWGNRYVIIINTNGTDAICNTADTSVLVPVKVGVISMGPNGVWDAGLNIDAPNEGTPTSAHDDIVSWRD
jgi:hypothetical protein